MAWYERHARVLPWRIGPSERRRGVRPNPYIVWVSEIMLQQTTVKAVVPYFRDFVGRWPGIADLAAAEDQEIMAAWAGLGYYARARNMIACARAVAARPGARFPTTAGELARLPGVGAYTAAAVVAIAHDEPVAVVDGNVERVVARLFALPIPLPAAKPVIREMLRPLVPGDRPGEFAEALMDLGAAICTPRKPACGLCPWWSPCLARRQGRQTELPLRTPRRARPTRYGTAFVARRADGSILLRRRPSHGLLGGMTEIPGSEWTEAGAAEATPPLDGDWLALAADVAHTFTHFQLQLSVRRADIASAMPAPPGHWWASPESLPHEALPSVIKKAIEAAYPGTTRPRKEER
ncbi:MAG TPA: A/G-specific adenine glycosylase [Propylenella sp.]